MKVILIVEGLKDADQIHNAFDYNPAIKTLVTEGTKFNNRIVNELEACKKESDCSVFILSDPDPAGDAIVEMVHRVYPDIPRLEADLKECSYFTGKKKKAGIEYASYSYLRKLIGPFIGLEYIEEDNINWDEVME